MKQENSPPKTYKLVRHSKDVCISPDLAKQFTNCYICGKKIKHFDIYEIETIINNVKDIKSILCGTEECFNMWIFKNME